MDDVVIAGLARTAIGKFGGSLSAMPASQLGVRIIRALLERTGLEARQIDEVILDQVLAAGQGQNPARQAALYAGLPLATAATTINKVYVSGLKSIRQATEALQCGEAGIIVSGSP